MASESITFDFISRGASTLAGDFKKTGDNAAAAARGAKVLQDTIKTLGDKENRTAAESANLARALKLTGDAEDRAAAKALAAEIAISRLDESMKKSSASTGDARGGFLGLAGEITGFGAATDAASGKSTLFARGLAGLNLASGVLEPALAGVVVAAGGIAAAYASAGIGLGVFGAVASSVLSQASAAATKYTAAQVKLNTATTSAQRTAALKAEQVALYGLDTAQKSVVFSIIGAQNAWQGFTRAATPGVAKVLAAAIKLLPEAFALLRPFLAPVESALTGVIGAMRTGIAPGSQFSKIMHDFAASSGTTLSLALRSAGNLFVGLLGVLHAFLPVGTQLIGWVEQATVKFREWGTTLSAHTGFQSLMATFRTETPQAVTILKNLGTVLLNVGKAVFGLSSFSNSKALLQLLLPLSGVLASLSKNTTLVRIALYALAAFKIGSAFSWIPGAWQGLVKFSAAAEGATAKEVIAAAATKVWAGAQAVFNAVMDANPIVLVAAAAAALGTAFVIAWKKSAGFRDFIKSIGVALLDVAILIVKYNKIIVDSFLSMVGTILHGAADAFGWIPGLGSKLRGASKAFDDFKAGTDNVFNGIIKTMQGWQNELGASRRTSDTTTAAIVANFKGQGKAALEGRQDVTDYTQAVQANGARSDAARSARIRLIADLRASGVGAQAAQRLVDNLQAAISRMHGKTVNVGVTGSGSGGVVITTSGIAAAGQGNVRFHAARGAYVSTGSGPTADDNLARVSKGELIVPARMVSAGAVDHLRGRIPGFASGGFVGVENALGQAAGVAGTYEGRGAAAAMAAGVKAAIAKEKAAIRAAAAQANPFAGISGVPTTPAFSQSAAVAQAFAKSILWAYGWGQNQFPPLQALWNEESGWRWNAQNPTSPAYGIPQADPGSKMASAGADWRTNYKTQIRWGLGYIKASYGNPARAYAFENSHTPHWYGSGLDAVFRQPTVIGVGERGPERVRVQPLTPAGGAGGGVHLHLTVNGPIGSQQQLEDWFVKTANRTARTGRLAQAVRAAGR